MRGFICGLLAVSMVMSGCTKTVVHRLAAYRPGEAAKVQEAPVASVYKAKVYGRDGKLHGIDGTERVLGKGQPLGFRTAQDGVVHAMAAGDSVPLALTADRKVVWFTQYRRQTQFGKEVRKAKDFAGEVASIVGILALAGGLLALEASTQSDDCK